MKVIKERKVEDQPHVYQGDCNNCGSTVACRENEITIDVLSMFDTISLSKGFCPVCKDGIIVAKKLPRRKWVI